MLRRVCAHRFAPLVYMCALLRGRTVSTALFLSLSLFLLFSLSGSLSSRPSSIRVCCALPISLCVCLPLSFALSPRPSPSYSLSLVVSSSRRTPSFAPYCHASVPLPAIRNAAVALLRYLRDVSYAAPSTRVVPPVSTWLLACSLARSLACFPASLPACDLGERARRTGLLARCV